MSGMVTEMHIHILSNVNMVMHLHNNLWQKGCLSEGCMVCMLDHLKDASPDKILQNMLGVAQF